MIPYIGCEAARDLLDAFVDGELAVEAQVMVESHLRWCRTCAARVEDMATIGAVVRLGPEPVRPRPEDEHALMAIQSEVLARVRAERDQSFPVRLRELFSDKRLVWPALGASFAVLFCICGAFAVMQLASVERPDSLAAMIASAHPGSDENPLRLDDAMLAPRVVSEAVSLARIRDDEAVFAVATVVTREGRVGNYELLLAPPRTTPKRRAGARADEELAAVLHAVKQSRFTPAQGASGRPVAVNMVLLFARTTVVRDAQLEELLKTGPQAPPVSERVDPVRVPQDRKPSTGEHSSERSSIRHTSTTA